MPDRFEMLPPFALRADALPEYVGTYVSHEVEPVYRISTSAGELVLRRLKHSAEVLRPVAPDLFAADFGRLALCATGRIRFRECCSPATVCTTCAYRKRRGQRPQPQVE